MENQALAKFEYFDMTTVSRNVHPALETTLDALDILPVALFCYDADSRQFGPLNAAARVLCDHSDMAAIAAAVSLSNWNDFNHGGLETRYSRDRKYALSRALIDGSDSHQWVVAVMPLAGVVETPSPNDALDDAFHDPLTRLPNRRLFQKRLARAIERAATSSYQFAVLFVDLDRFKAVNDRFGHLIGDQMLVAAAQRLLASVRPQDMVARRDGDEFTVLLDDLADPADAQRVAERICEQMRQPLQMDGNTAAVGASVGIVTSAAGEQTAESLIATADAAMYHAKALGGGTFVTLPKTLPR